MSFNNFHLAGESQEKSKPEKHRGKIPNFKGKTKKVLEKNRLLNPILFQVVPVELS